jgi:hypothetical protein
VVGHRQELFTVVCCHAAPKCNVDVKGVLLACLIDFGLEIRERGRRWDGRSGGKSAQKVFNKKNIQTRSQGIVNEARVAAGSGRLRRRLEILTVSARSDVYVRINQPAHDHFLAEIVDLLIHKKSFLSRGTSLYF